MGEFCSAVRLPQRITALPVATECLVVAILGVTLFTGRNGVVVSHGRAGERQLVDCAPAVIVEGVCPRVPAPPEGVGAFDGLGAATGLSRPEVD